MLPQGFPCLSISYILTAILLLPFLYLLPSTASVIVTIASLAQRHHQHFKLFYCHRLLPLYCHRLGKVTASFIPIAAKTCFNPVAGNRCVSSSKVSAAAWNSWIVSIPLPGIAAFQASSCLLILQAIGFNPVAGNRCVSSSATRKHWYFYILFQSRCRESLRFKIKDDVSNAFQAQNKFQSRCRESLRFKTLRWN